MINKSAPESNKEPNNYHPPVAHGAALHKQDPNHIDNKRDADSIWEELAWYPTKHLRQGNTFRSYSWPGLPRNLQNKLKVVNVSDEHCN